MTMRTICNRQADVSTLPEQASGSDVASASEALALNWLEGHTRILGFWLDRLVAENADIALIDTLHRQSAWLQIMQDRLAR